MNKHKYARIHMHRTITCIGMLGIGASTDYRLVIKYIKKPTAYLLGVITQLLLVPRESLLLLLL